MRRWQADMEALAAEFQAQVLQGMAGSGGPADLLAALGRVQEATPYRVLGLDPSAPDDVVRLVYRHLARQHHPDRGGDPARMAEINRAYQQIAKMRGWK